MFNFSDQGMAALVCNNHDLEEIALNSCTLLTDASFIAIADNCPQLKSLAWLELPNVVNYASELYVQGKCPGVAMKSWQ